MDLFIKAGSIYAEEGIVQSGILHIRDGYIYDIYRKSELISKEYYSKAQWINTPHNIFPGLLDLHIHGIKGHDVMDCSIASLEEISKALAVQGVTGFLATTVTDDTWRTEEALRIVREAYKAGVPGARILGAYVEGPYISAKQKGAHPEHLIREIDINEISNLIEDNEAIKIMALAPEKENAIELIEYLKTHNIIAAIGHTDATYEESMTAIDKGASIAIHTYNGMRGLHHREPGALGAVLTDDRIYAEVIADMIHVHPAAIKLIHKCKKDGKLCLISDCMRAGGLADGNYSLGQEEITVKNGIPRTQSGGLAGSTLKLINGVKNMYQVLGIDLLEAIHMASLIPAKILGLEGETGSIKKGKKADFIIVDEGFNVLKTYISGECIVKND